MNSDRIICVLYFSWLAKSFDMVRADSVAWIMLKTSQHRTGFLLSALAYWLCYLVVELELETGLQVRGHQSADLTGSGHGSSSDQVLDQIMAHLLLCRGSKPSQQKQSRFANWQSLMDIPVSSICSFYTSAQHSVAGNIPFLSYQIHPCMHPETLLTRYLAEYLTHFHQTYAENSTFGAC